MGYRPRLTCNPRFVAVPDCTRLHQTAQAKIEQILDFVIWQLFQRETKATSWPRHLLCDGFRKRAREGDPASTTIPGVYSLYPNSHVAALMLAPWPHLLALLGQSGQRIMIDLLLDCSIFVTVGAGLGNYFQHSGMPAWLLHQACQSLTCSRSPLVRVGTVRWRPRPESKWPACGPKTFRYNARQKPHLLRQAGAHCSWPCSSRLQAHSYGRTKSLRDGSR